MGCINYMLSGLVKDCQNSKGGIQKVLISTENPKPTVNDGAINGFGQTTEWHEYNFKKNTSSFTSTLNIDQANSINYVSTELILQFNKMQTVKRVEMAGLAVNDMWVCVLDCNNKWWFMGFDEPVNASAGSGQTGTAKTDGNFYQITLSNDSKTWLYEIDENAIPDLDSPIIRGWSGLTLDGAVRNDNAFRVEGDIKKGATVTLISNISWQQQTFYDKDTREIIGERYNKTVQLTLDKADTNIYNIAIIGR